jgi:hypothetical protein
MIPYEVAEIARELGLHFKGSEEDGLEYYVSLAYKIYNRLQKDKA